MASILPIVLFLCLSFHCHSHSASPVHRQLTFTNVHTLHQSRGIKEGLSHFLPTSVVPRGGDANKQEWNPPSPDPIGSSNNNDSDTPSKDEAFDAAALSKQLRREEIHKIKKSQLFLKKQQRRREMDKTWLDRGITATIEFWENIFRWEVVDV
ncbi:hypothetical protein HJC23_004724 [Cyclotella cryptica]|uniref:Uncharacterized protein n=1 Tax=Cyclotella cryptica TaxID=29204 RepID=A0ABD3PRQ7_9STRA|eukprot:CCRYP_012062-RA/>CCRYP_012062-RA protein AED:0.35 eAED:0.35 QI:0/-1/0/1/-1/1/1/0/152